MDREEVNRYFISEDLGEPFKICKQFEYMRERILDYMSDTFTDEDYQKDKLIVDYIFNLVLYNNNEDNLEFYNNHLRVGSNYLYDTFEGSSITVPDYANSSIHIGPEGVQLVDVSNIVVHTFFTMENYVSYLRDKEINSLL